MTKNLNIPRIVRITNLYTFLSGFFPLPAIDFCAIGQLFDMPLIK